MAASVARLGESRLDELDLYLYGLRLGGHLAAARRFDRGLRYLVRPVPYWRSIEYRLVWSAGSFTAKHRVLDVGSPKLLSLYLAETVGAEVYATDLSDYFLEEFAFLRAARGVPEDRMHLEVQDGRALTYADSTFDVVYSISVIEHIPEDGDSACMREIGRVLSPGGKCVVTVPFGIRSREVYRDRDFYWSGSLRERADGRVFYYRRYSEDDLYTRLIRPSGMTVERIEFVGERFLTRSSREVVDLLVPPTGPAEPLLSRLAHTGPASSWKRLAKPLAALLVMVKP